MRKFMRSPLYDEGFSVYATPDIESLQAVVDVCQQNGLEPKKEITDEKTIRALMSDGHTVFNTTRPDVWQEMGRPAGAPMLRVKDPEVAAENARALFAERGILASVIEPMADQTAGKMFFVRTPALECGMIGFREHVTKMGDRPPKWRVGKALDFTKNED